MTLVECDLGAGSMSESIATEPRSAEEIPAPVTDEGRATEADRSRQVFRTLKWVVFAGVAVSAWVLYFTDWFPFFLSLLTLGGIFAWVSFVAGMLTEDRKRGLQHIFEAKVLARRWVPLAVLIGTFVLLLVLSAMGGTIVVETYGDQEHRALTLEPMIESEAFKWLTPWLTRRESLSPHGSHKLYVWHLLFFRDFRLDISRLPSERVQVASFRRMRLVIPDDLQRRPVLLIRPSYPLSTSAMHTPQESADALFLIVERGDETVVENELFTGKALWLGGGPDLVVPAELLASWRAEIKGQFGEDAAISWLPAVGRRQIYLSAGETLRIALVPKDGGEPYAETFYTITGQKGELSWPQEVKLDVRPPESVPGFADQ